MSERPNWFYDELRQVGLDFEDASLVETYDRKQGADRGAERALIERLGIAPGDVVVDMGCGTGCFALEAAHRGAEVHGVDVSKAMLAHVRRKADAAGLGGLTCHHGGFLTYRHPGPPAEVIVTRYALHHLPDFWKMAALVRLAGMLADGGRLYLEDVVFSFDPAGYREGIEAWIGRMAKPDGAGFTTSDFETHAREEYSTYAWILESILGRAGFEILDRDLSDPAYASYLCTRSA